MPLNSSKIQSIWLWLELDPRPIFNNSSTPTFNGQSQGNRGRGRSHNNRGRGGGRPYRGGYQNQDSIKVVFKAIHVMQHLRIFKAIIHQHQTIKSHNVRYAIRWDTLPLIVIIRWITLSKANNHQPNLLQWLHLHTIQLRTIGYQIQELQIISRMIYLIFNNLLSIEEVFLF